jgi:dGTPase
VAGAEEVREYPRRIAAFTGEAAATSLALKGLLHERVYSAPALGQGRQRSMAMIAELFRFFADHPDQLPAPYAARTLVEPRHRVICDYIAGMTDGYCERTFEQAIGPAGG